MLSTMPSRRSGQRVKSGGTARAKTVPARARPRAIRAASTSRLSAFHARNRPRPSQRTGPIHRYGKAEGGRQAAARFTALARRSPDRLLELGARAAVDPVEGGAVERGRPPLEDHPAGIEADDAPG